MLLGRGKDPISRVDHEIFPQIQISVLKIRGLVRTRGWGMSAEVGVGADAGGGGAVTAPAAVHRRLLDDRLGVSHRLVRDPLALRLFAGGTLVAAGVGGVGVVVGGGGGGGPANGAGGLSSGLYISLIVAVVSVNRKPERF